MEREIKIYETQNKTGNEVKGWDPYARNEPKTQHLSHICISCEYENITADIILEPYILPPRDDFSSRDAWENASGPKKWNQQQGFYVYRNGRMIQSGGWSRLRTPDEHTKLARIALSFSPVLDEAFKINVSKMRVYLPAQIRDQVENAIEPIVRMARTTYDNPSRSSQTISRMGNRHISQIPNQRESNASPRPNEGTVSDNPLIGSGPGLVTTPFSYFAPQDSEIIVASVTRTEEPNSNPQLWTLEQIMEKISEIAEPEELPVITRVFHRLRSNMSLYI